MKKSHLQVTILAVLLSGCVSYPEADGPWWCDENVTDPEHNAACKKEVQKAERAKRRHMEQCADYWEDARDGVVIIRAGSRFGRDCD